MSWAATEFRNLDLGDPRRNRRAIRLMEKLSAKPTASIPGACGDWADTIGAYRFFNNEEVEWSAILAPHIQNSVTRMAAHDVVLWARELKDKDGHRAGIKESVRWIEGYERLAEMAEKMPTTRLVYLADREADIMALMVRARDLATPWTGCCAPSTTAP